MFNEKYSFNLSKCSQNLFLFSILSRLVIVGNFTLNSNFNTIMSLFNYDKWNFFFKYTTNLDFQSVLQEIKAIDIRFTKHIIIISPRNLASEIPLIDSSSLNHTYSLPQSSFEINLNVIWVNNPVFLSFHNFQFAQLTR